MEIFASYQATLLQLCGSFFYLMKERKNCNFAPEKNLKEKGKKILSSTSYRIVS